MIAFLVAAVFTGAIAGAFAWAVLFAMDIGLRALWERVPIYLGEYYPIVVCAIGGLVIGNSKFPYKRNTMGFIDGLSWLFQLLMFLVLGLLVTPHNLGKVVIPALIVSAVMILVARPLAVYLSMWPFKKYNRIDKAYVSWVGLKGAVPIILTIKCASDGVENSDILFNIAFVCTLVSLLAQGTTLSSLGRKLHLALPQEDRKQPTHFDISLPEEIQEKALEVYVTEEMAPVGTHLMDLGLSKDSLVIMLRRGDEYIFPNGQTLVEEGDYLLLMSDEEHAVVRTYDEEKIWELELIQHTGEFLSNVFNVDEKKREEFVEKFKSKRKKKK